MPNRMKTGIPGLDDVFEGGLLYHNCVLVRGLPGTGKTTLGIQTIHNGALQHGEPGIIVLFEQFRQQLLRDVAAYQWDLEALEKQNRIAIIFSRPDDILASDKMSDSRLINQISEITTEIGARRILLDGFSNFLGMIQTDRNERDIFLKFINSIKSLGLTPILTAEGLEGGAASFEDYLSDCVIHLSNRAVVDPTFQTRWLEVLKTRGHGHVRGRHPYRISQRGIEVFPHLPPQPHAEKGIGAGPDMASCNTGVNGLDEMLGGGYTAGSSTVVVGMPGTFKTTLGVQFLIAGADKGERGLYIGYNESPEFLVRSMRGKGLDLAPRIDGGQIVLWHYYPKQYYVEEMLLRLEKELAGGGLARLVVDGVNELDRSVENPAMREELATMTAALLRRYGVTALFIQNLENFTPNAPLTGVRYADLLDGVIYLGAVEIESALRKVISILKMRGGQYAGDLREIACGRNGLYVMDKFAGMSGILAGNAQGHYKKTVEEIFQPLNFVSDFIRLLGESETTEAQRREITSNLTTVVEGLTAKLKDYFGVESSQ